MSKRFREGDVIQRFSFDTPYHPANDFYSLCSDEQPVCMVFLRNFGHPITRHYILAYAQDHAQLLDARLVVVVRSDPATLAKNIPEGVIPFTILCDPEGVLAEYFARQAVSGWRGRSGESARILRSAKKEGFREEKGPQPLPLTLLVGEGGRVLYAHYGRTFTDLPENSAAVQRVSRAWLDAQPPVVLTPADIAPEEREEPEPPIEPIAPVEPAAPESEQATYPPEGEPMDEAFGQPAPRQEEPTWQETPLAPSAAAPEDFAQALRAEEEDRPTPMEDEALPFQMIPGQSEEPETDYTAALKELFGGD